MNDGSKKIEEIIENFSVCDRAVLQDIRFTANER